MGLIGKSSPSAVVGLDIGSDLIKVAEAKFGKSGIQITGLGVAPTPPAAVDNSVVVDAQALGAAIKGLLRESGIKTKQVVSTIMGQSSVVVRVIEVPKMTREELAETMKWEVERHVPFSPSEILMDFAPIERPNTVPDAQNMEVLLAVAQQGAVNTHVQTLFAAGLEPLAIDVQPLAISRALIDVSKEDLPQTTAVVNIGATSTDVGVFEGDMLTFPGPPLPIAGINFTRAVSEALGISEEEAEALKRQYAVAEIPVVQPADMGAGGDYGSAQPADHEPTSFDTSFTQYDTMGDPLPTDVNPPDQAEEPNPADVPSQPEAAVDLAAEGSGEPAPDDLSSGPAAGSDFSAFDFDIAAPSPALDQVSPEQAPGKGLDISGKDDVFDLGAVPETSEFKPVFDLDEPEVGVGAAPQEKPAVDFDIEGDQIPPVMDAGQTPRATDNVGEEGFGSEYRGAMAVGPANDVRRHVSDAINPVLQELATEIRRTLEYYATRYQNRPEQIFLCGGTAKMRNLDKFLEAELGVPVRVADPMANLTVNCPKCSQQYISEVSALFPVSIGLAIRDMLE